MRIYEYDTDAEGYQWFYILDNYDIFFTTKLIGKSLKHNWKSINISPIDDENMCDLKGDFLTIDTGTTPIFSESATDIFSKYLTVYGEFLSLISKNSNYFVFNVMLFIDALDESRSNIVEYDNQIARITHYHFYEDKIDHDTFIFKIPQLPWQRVFVTDKFIDIVNENNLEGLKCKLVWDDGPLPINPNDIVTVI